MWYCSPIPVCSSCCGPSYCSPPCGSSRTYHTGQVLKGCHMCQMRISMHAAVVCGRGVSFQKMMSIASLWRTCLEIAEFLSIDSSDWEITGCGMARERMARGVGWWGADVEQAEQVCVTEKAVDVANNQAVWYLAHATGLCEGNAQKSLNFCPFTTLTEK